MLACRAMDLTGAAAAADPAVAARFDIARAYNDTMIAVAPARWMRDADDPDVTAAQARIELETASRDAIDEAGRLADVAAQAAQAAQAAKAGVG